MLNYPFEVDLQNTNSKMKIIKNYVLRQVSQSMKVAEQDPSECGSLCDYTGLTPMKDVLAQMETDERMS